MTNYGPFRGTFTLDLAASGADVFAVTARWEDDEDRSNWGGKSYLVHGIPLALFDEYPSASADGWVSEGEKEGILEISTSDGSKIDRSRVIGQSTQLRYLPGDAATAKDFASGKHGQAELEKRIGLSSKDFFATSFVRQKEVNRFVVATPGERLAIVAEWLGLDRLRDARKRAGSAFVSARASVIANKVEPPTELLDRLEHDVLGVRYDTIQDDDAELRKTVADELETWKLNVRELEKGVESARAKFEVERGEIARVAKLESDAARFEELAETGRSYQAKLKVLPVVGDAELADAVARKENALVLVRKTREAFERAGELARGEFSGSCPVNGRSCPVAKEISGDLERNRKLLKTEKANLDTAAKASLEAQEVTAKLESSARERELVEERLKATADQARGLKAAFQEARKLGEAPKPVQTSQEAYEAAVRSLEGARTHLRSIEVWLRDFEAFSKRNALYRAKSEETARELAIAADQVEVFARAEREIGRATLLEIEEIANRLLGSAGIDLTVRMSWGRETGTLEPTCHRCGWSYPRGQATKACGDCGAERLPKIEERLDLVASARSKGAAEDLAGLAIQLAAAAWLRAERGIRWGVVVLDEVTASLDKSHRRSIGRVLATMIREAGFEQGFVISHSPDVVESLPGRIEIVASKSGSKVRVVA
jgi:DNA repair exonuclease SbcCD ATPase subunit